MNILENLLKIKSIVTLVCMGVFVYMSVTNQLQSEVVAGIISSVITYYFTKREGE